MLDYFMLKYRSNIDFDEEFDEELEFLTQMEDKLTTLISDAKKSRKDYRWYIWPILRYEKSIQYKYDLKNIAFEHLVVLFLWDKY